VYDGSSSLLVFRLGDPHGLESRERTQNRSSDPHQELPLSRGNYLDFHGGWGKGCHLFAETFRDAWEHGGSATHHNVAIEIFADVNVALQDRLVGYFVEAGHFFADHHGLEQSLRASEPLGAHLDGLTVGQFVGFEVLG